ncbi:hypothetical protein [Shewanella algae]
MSVLEKFKVDDLSYAVSKFTFILESPHHQEVKNGYPAAGDTGVSMSKALFKLDEPLGKLAVRQSNLIPRLSLINCSRIPLQRSCYGSLELKRDFINFLEIQNVCDGSIDILKYKIKGKLRTKLGLNAIDSFRSRLIDNITHCTNPKVIICGVIAQCFFEEATKLQCKLHKSTEVNWKGSDFNVFYEYHPSPKSGKWSNSSNLVDLLKFMS